MKSDLPLHARLKHRVQILQNISGSEFAESRWTVLTTIYCEINSISEASAREFDDITFGYISNENYYIFTARFNDYINNTMKLRFRNRIFDIKKLINPLERNKIIKIFAVEIMEN